MAGKKDQVTSMFNSIAGKYDFLNHLLSFGIDKWWRKRAIQHLKQDYPKKILDLACGTGDFAIASMRLHPEFVTGIDISENMLEIGQKKIQEHNLQDKINLIKGDSENLPFDNSSFDAVTVAFGVRNFENLHKGLSEANRVLKTKGRMVILEFSNPRIFPVKQLYQFYFNVILPAVGRVFSKDKSAYSYLPSSVNTFPEGSDFLNEMANAGFRQLSAKKLTFGICSIYSGIK